MCKLADVFICVVYQIAACHLGKNGQAGVEDPSMAILPFVLIQGPPGTAPISFAQRRSLSLESTFATSLPRQLPQDIEQTV